MKWQTKAKYILEIQMTIESKTNIRNSNDNRKQNTQQKLKWQAKAKYTLENELPNESKTHIRIGKTNESQVHIRN